jgi:hypothetical protein
MRTHPGPTLTLRYEDLLASPAERLGEVFDWLGLPVGAPDVARIVENHAFDSIAAEKRGSEQFYRAATPGLWRENLTEAEQDAVRRVIGPKLAELGYAG